MNKVIKTPIHSCSRCPYMKAIIWETPEKDEYICKRKDKKLDFNSFELFPEWCPLENL
jgi:hypothetical protein